MASQYFIDYGDENLRRMNNLYAKFSGMPLRESIDNSCRERSIPTWDLTDVLIAELDRIGESGEIPIKSMVNRWNEGGLGATGFYDLFRIEMITLYEVLRKQFSKEDVEILGFR